MVDVVFFVVVVVAAVVFFVIVVVVVVVVVVVDVVPTSKLTFFTNIKGCGLSMITIFSFKYISSIHH